MGIEGAITQKQKQAMGLDEQFREATTESEDEMVDRLLAALRGAGTALRMSKQSGTCRFAPPRWFAQ